MKRSPRGTCAAQPTALRALIHPDIIQKSFFSLISGKACSRSNNGAAKAVPMRSPCLRSAGWLALLRLALFKSAFCFLQFYHLGNNVHCIAALYAETVFTNGAAAIAGTACLVYLSSYWLTTRASLYVEHITLNKVAQLAMHYQSKVEAVRVAVQAARPEQQER